MPMLFQPTTSLADLSRMNDIPVDMTLEGLNQYRQGRQADQMAMDDLPGLIQHNQNMRPLQEQSLAANSAATLAQIPGMQADARMKNVQADTLEKTQQSNIEALIAQNGHKKMQAYLDEMSGLGPLMLQAGAQLEANPLGGHRLVKQMLEKSGHSDMWNDTYEQMPPQQLAQVLRRQGAMINASLPNYQKAIDTAALKAEYAARLEAAKIESREKIATQRTTAAREMKNWELANARFLDKPTYQSLGARYEEFARQALEDGNQEQAQKFMAEAKRVNTLAMQLPAVVPNVLNQGKVDPTALTNGAIPTLNAGRTSTATPSAVYPEREGQQSKVQPKSAQEAQAAGWKLHQDANGNKAYVSPDGKSYFEAK